jgi:deazaflavin-dependent oxidoreductase (nitroreductase family)
VRRRPPLRLLRLANPVVRLVLRSPCHRILSGSLMLLTYRGARTGRSFTIPLRYARRGDAVLALAVAPRSKQWWRAFQSRAAATLAISGRVRAVDGRLLAGPEADEALGSYLARFPRSSWLLEAGADEIALVEFVPR